MWAHVEGGSSRVSALGRSPTWSLQDDALSQDPAQGVPAPSGIHSTLPNHRKGACPPGPQLQGAVEGSGEWVSG